ncbi:MAG: carboxypeptidase M32 [Desulfobulbaceae bacterium]|nr:carboxypeptidase M32 [Pseudomonadota bacterium]MCG2746087.1 carboxypeptidase M32 [Desulfobulbaceae bacterium]
MSDKLQKLTILLAEISDVNNAMALLGWDQQTYMPKGGAEARGNQLATLSRIAHQKFTTAEIGTLLADLEGEFAGAEPDSDVARLLEVTRHEFDRKIRVPADFVGEFALVTSRAFEAWVKARAASDFSIFRPHLEKVVELNKRYINFFPPADHPYDILLDQYERGMKTAEIQMIFADLRPRQVALLKEITARPQVDDSFLQGPFDEQQQWDFGVKVISAFGYDWNRGRQDRSAHPFTTNFSINDVRITTRFETDHPVASLFSTMHEAGHALYELGCSQSFERSPLAGGASLAVHESQSRLWENLVGRSLPFWEHFYPEFRRRFPAALDGVDLRTFYLGINRVEPSLIRVNADEATYNLHVMLRLELEIGMIEGRIAVRALPGIWNAKMEEYLGITPPNDAQGVLQDVHWSGGSLGYFATYTLGNLISAQLWEKIHCDIPDLDDQLRQGSFAALLTWLQEKIHCHGRKFKPQELVMKVTGTKIDPGPYIRYLTGKYSDIYGLQSR